MGYVIAFTVGSWFGALIMALMSASNDKKD